jgi:hypothetical protein
MSFDHITDNYSRTLLLDAYQAMFKSNSWDALIAHGDDTGFQYTDEAKPLLGHMNLLELHSGTSMAWVMSHMKKISKMGYVGYVKDFMKLNTSDER